MMREGGPADVGHSPGAALVRIRPAREADVPAILGFIRELAEYEKLLHEVVATEEALRTTLFGDHPAAEVLMAEVLMAEVEASAEAEERCIGFALFFPTYSTFLARPGVHLEDLYVTPAFRGRGVGRALLSRLARTVVERGWGRLEWAVLDWNAPAIGFYRKLGAVPMDEWTTFRLTGEALEALAGE
jgi:GNAT superfamily N-acetyltransferase